MLTLLPSCENGKEIDFCAKTGPIYTSKNDVITGGTAREIDVINDNGQILCGWEPPHN